MISTNFINFTRFKCFFFLGKVSQISIDFKKWQFIHIVKITTIILNILIENYTNLTPINISDKRYSDPPESENLVWFSGN